MSLLYENAYGINLFKLKTLAKLIYNIKLLHIIEFLEK